MKISPIFSSIVLALVISNTIIKLKDEYLLLYLSLEAPSFKNIKQWKQDIKKYIYTKADLRWQLSTISS